MGNPSGIVQPSERPHPRNGPRMRLQIQSLLCRWSKSIFCLPKGTGNQILFMGSPTRLSKDSQWESLFRGISRGCCCAHPRPVPPDGFAGAFRRIGGRNLSFIIPGVTHEIFSGRMLDHQFTSSDHSLGDLHQIPFRMEKRGQRVSLPKELYGPGSIVGNQLPLGGMGLENHRGLRHGAAGQML